MEDEKDWEITKKEYKVVDEQYILEKITKESKKRNRKDFWVRTISILTVCTTIFLFTVQQYRETNRRIDESRNKSRQDSVFAYIGCTSSIADLLGTRLIDPHFKEVRNKCVSDYLTKVLYYKDTSFAYFMDETIRLIEVHHAQKELYFNYKSVLLSYDSLRNESHNDWDFIALQNNEFNKSQRFLVTLQGFAELDYYETDTLQNEITSFYQDSLSRPFTSTNKYTQEFRNQMEQNRLTYLNMLTFSKSKLFDRLHYMDSIVKKRYY